MIDLIRQVNTQYDASDLWWQVDQRVGAVVKIAGRYIAEQVRASNPVQNSLPGNGTVRNGDGVGQAKPARLGRVEGGIEIEQNNIGRNWRLNALAVQHRKFVLKKLAGGAIYDSV